MRQNAPRCSFASPRKPIQLETLNLTSPLEIYRVQHPNISCPTPKYIVSARQPGFLLLFPSTSARMTQPGPSQDLGEDCMPYFYKVDKARRIVLSTASGAFSLADFRSHQENLSKDPEFDPTYSQIADFSHITHFDLSAEEIRQMALHSVFHPDARRAFIAPDDVVYGSSRMYQTFREDLGATGIGVFRTLEEALDWILSE